MPRFWNQTISRFSKNFRAKRGQILREYFPKINSWRILDVGGSRHFWQESGLDVAPQNITIYNLDSGDAHAIKKDKYAGITIKHYDGKKIPEPAQSFELAICNSVIEHVPPTQRRDLINELTRVARHVYVQTPAKSFPIEPHFLMPFLQWLPKRIGYLVANISPWRLLSRPSQKTVRSYFWETNLLSLKEIQNLTPHAIIIRERLLGFTKSFIAIV